HIKSVDTILWTPASRGSSRFGGVFFQCARAWHTGLMSIFIVRLGTPRKRGEGLRLGTVRRPPRGIAKADFARLDYYDVWFPNLSPSAELVQEALGAADERGTAAF